MGKTLSGEKIQGWNKLYYKVAIVFFRKVKVEDNLGADQ